MWAKILQAVLQLAGPSKINFMTVFQWFLTHTDNIKKAYADLSAGADWTAVITDLFQQVKAFASSKRGVTMARDHETCCKEFCTGIGHALVEYHSGNPDNALKHVADALIALSAECEVPNEPCEPCSDDEMNQCKAIASGSNP